MDDREAKQVYIESTISNINGVYYITFKEANWIHNHPMTRLFIESNSIITQARIDEIKEMTINGSSAIHLSLLKKFIEYDTKKRKKDNNQKLTN